MWTIWPGDPCATYPPAPKSEPTLAQGVRSRNSKFFLDFRRRPPPPAPRKGLRPLLSPVEIHSLCYRGLQSGHCAHIYGWLAGEPRALIDQLRRFQRNNWSTDFQMDCMALASFTRTRHGLVPIVDLIIL